MKKTSLVTGGMGFIGSHIVDQLIQLGHNVIVIDDMSARENEKFYKNENAENIAKDISRDDCLDYFKNVDYVFHLAARSRIQPTIGNPNECFEVNVVGTQRVLEWSRVQSVERVVYSGTSSLYGHQNAVPFQPNMPTDCLNPYSMSKWMGEQVCKLYGQLYGVRTTVLRYFNVYGPREPIRGQYAPVIGLFKRQKREGKPMTIIGTGDQRRDFTHVLDVVRANVLAISLADEQVFGIYNVGTGVNFSINEIADMIGGERVYVPRRPAEVHETLADISLTAKELGWKPSLKLEEEILHC
jgi:UDP-glucose 4-epimerase